jgi:hypothetical protein
MANQAAASDVHHPVLADAGARIESGFDIKIKVQSAIRNFNHQLKILRLRIIRDSCAIAL